MSVLKKALFVRMDRIGDLVFTLPIDQIQPSVPLQVEWWLTPGVEFVAQNAIPPRPFRTVPKKLQWSLFFQLYHELKQNNYDVALVIHAPWWVGFLLWLNRVPIRIGLLSQWHSFLFFNRGVRQSRSRHGLHELEYNFRLLEQGLRLKPESLPRQPLRLQVPPSVALPTALIDQDYFVVHPGMGGSALNWQTQNYVRLIQLLTKTARVVITGTATDESYLAPIRKQLSGNPHVTWLNGKLSAVELLRVLQDAKTVFAPSTGVLHLAASLGTTTLGIFSPVFVQSLNRWGPKGPRAKGLAPDVKCPGQMACLGRSCQYFDCLDNITPEHVVAAAQALMVK